MRKRVFSQREKSIIDLTSEASAIDLSSDPIDLTEESTDVPRSSDLEFISDDDINNKLETLEERVLVLEEGLVVIKEFINKIKTD